MRVERIAERIMEELSEMLLQEVSDPRLSGIFITDVKVDRELAYANIYVSALEGSERAEEILVGLEHAQGYLRRELVQRIDLRTFPRLRFRWDATFERAERIEQLFASLDSERDARESQGQAEERPAHPELDQDELAHLDPTQDEQFESQESEAEQDD
jgi:ribosome-binding factor A